MADGWSEEPKVRKTGEYYNASVQQLRLQDSTDRDQASAAMTLLTLVPFNGLATLLSIRSRFVHMRRSARGVPLMLDHSRVSGYYFRWEGGHFVERFCVDPRRGRLVPSCALVVLWWLPIGRRINQLETRVNGRDGLSNSDEIVNTEHMIGHCVDGLRALHGSALLLWVSISLYLSESSVLLQCQKRYSGYSALIRLSYNEEERQQ